MLSSILLSIHHTSRIINQNRNTESNVKNHLYTPEIVLLDLKLVEGHCLDFVIEGVPAMVYLLTAYSCLKASIAILMQHDIEGREHCKLGLEEEYQLGEPVVSKLLQVWPRELHFPGLLSLDGSRVYHGVEEGQGGVA